jgi:hypothetical protein
MSLTQYSTVQTIRKVLAVASMETHHIFCTANQTHNIITQYLQGDRVLLGKQIELHLRNSDVRHPRCVVKQ